MKFVPLTAEHWDWIQERIGSVLVSDTKGVAVESDSGDIWGVCACHSWTDGCVQMHIAIDNPIVLKNGRFQREVFSYVFETCGRSIILGIVPEHNAQALRFDKKIGFVELTRVTDGYASGEDLVILELRKENCKWISENTHDCNEPGTRYG